MSGNAQQAEQLTQRYLDGTISAEELETLNSWLAGEESARSAFSEWLNLDSALAETAAGWEGETGSRESFPTEVVPFFRRRITLLAAAAAVALLAVFLLVSKTTQPDSFATITNGAGAAEFSNGDTLRGETYSIQAGTVELVTAKGARVAIEAPSTFRFESAQRLQLIRGRLAADVPPSATGFTVVTPEGDAIDLGTRFGVDVPESGQPEIHVFQGEVIARTGKQAGTKTNLREGDALSLNQNNPGTARDLRSAAFIHPDEVSSLAAAISAGQQPRSEIALQKVRNDPSLIALIDFEDNPPEGTYRPAQGRWPGSRAPEIVQVGDHIKLTAGEGLEFPQLTLAAWVRLDQLGAPYQSLLHTDGWSAENPGQVHWMITRNTTMRLALRGNTLAPGADEEHGYPDSRTPISPAQGRWTHLATIYDAEKKTVRFFLNGVFDKETRQEIAYPAKLGAAQIGNWDQHDRKLSGRIDEILILGRALSDSEILELFEAGNPYR